MQVFNRVSVAVAVACMATFSHAGIVWQGGMDDARRNATAFITSPKGKVAGLVWSLDPKSTGYTLNRSPLLITDSIVKPIPGSLYGFRPSSPYGISGKPAVIDVPSSVRVPGTVVDVPARIIEPVSKSTLARIIAKGIPVLGTAITIAELLDQAELTFGNGTWLYRDTSVPSSSPSGYQWAINGTWVPIPDGAYADRACTWFGRQFHGTDVASFDSVKMICTVQISYNNFARYPVTNRVIGTNTSLVSISPEQAAEIIERDTSDQTLVAAVDAIAPDVIDVVARELQHDDDDVQIRWPTGTSTIQVGDPYTETHQSSDGSTRTRTVTTIGTTSGRDVSFSRVTRDVVTSPTGQVISDTTTTQDQLPRTNPNSPNADLITCGLPDTPPCKIDETGTPSPPDVDGENVFRQAIPNCLKTDWKTCFPELPDINWSFTLPSGCAPIPVPFERFGFTAVNICPWQGMIHDLMSMLWAAAGLFGAIGILSGRRNTEG